ncbi:MAG TPA: hypothetical protein PKZ35_13470 [Gammaproteobacteria bacterium]|nr:hypothetical protein [Chromatiaceae bacterium]HPE81001.1 hypothetical protein [Gammaproteobacteria bacterium]
MLRLNINRTFTVPVPVTYVDEAGAEQHAKFSATFRVPSKDDLDARDNQGKLLLDLVLTGVREIELTDADGRGLEGDDLLAACKADHTLSTALVSAYWENAAKKPQPRT